MVLTALQLKQVLFWFIKWENQEKLSNIKIWFVREPDSKTQIQIVWLQILNPWWESYTVWPGLTSKEVLTLSYVRIPDKGRQRMMPPDRQDVFEVDSELAWGIPSMQYSSLFNKGLDLGVHVLKSKFG